jgi:hypothetical protein
MTVADLAVHLSQTPDEKTRWKTFWEFLEEYRWEPQAPGSSTCTDCAAERAPSRRAR